LSSFKTISISSSPLPHLGHALRTFALLINPQNNTKEKGEIKAYGFKFYFCKLQLWLLMRILRIEDNIEGAKLHLFGDIALCISL
jgi:hypothetical protein